MSDSAPIYAHALVRLGAFAVDCVLLLTVWMLGAALGVLVNGSNSSASGVVLGVMIGVLGCYLVGVMLAVALWGWSPGKLMFGLRVVRADGDGAPGVVSAAVRGILLASAILPLWGILLLISTTTHDDSRQWRGWHDLAAHTAVLDVRQRG